MPDLNINKSPEKEVQIKESSENKELMAAQEKVDSSLDVADVLEGVEMGEVNEKVTEKKERKSEASRKQKQLNTKPKSKKTIKARPLPSSNVMRRRVIHTMEDDIKKIFKSLPSKASKNPYEYAEKIKEIRGLRQKIFDFFRTGVDKIKDFYLKLFGKKHGIKEEKTEE